MPSSPESNVWMSIVDGDPGPAVAFFDRLMESDLHFAASGLLLDIALRIHDADQHLADDRVEIFRATARDILWKCLDGNEPAFQELLADAARQRPDE